MGHTYMTSHTLDGYTKDLLISTDGPVTFFGFRLDGPVASSFLFYINDIAVGLQSTDRLFADDTMLYLTIKNDQDTRSLQHDLHLLCEWEARSLMEFHPDKCEVISVTRKKHPTLHPYYIHGHWPPT